MISLGPKGVKQARVMNCAVSPPERPAAALTNATGLSFHILPGVRLNQSSAFFRTPEMPLLYSGLAIIIASAFSITAATSFTFTGIPVFSISSSNNGSEMSTSSYSSGR